MSKRSGERVPPKDLSQECMHRKTKILKDRARATFSCWVRAEKMARETLNPELISQAEQVMIDKVNAEIRYELSLTGRTRCPIVTMMRPADERCPVWGDLCTPEDLCHECKQAQ